MAHTSEQRDKLRTPLCGAKARTTGKPCRKFAGEGTDHLGIGKCRYHGGRTGSHRKHALAIEVKRRMVQLGEPLENVNAPDALMHLLRVTAGHVEWLRTAVANVDELGEREAEVLVKLYDSERDRLTRVGEACIRAGVAEIIVRATEAQMASYVRAFKNIVEELRLTDGQRAALGPAIRKHIPHIDGDDPDTSQDERIAAGLALDGPPEEWAV